MQRAETPSLGIVIPVYNEMESIPALVSRLTDLQQSIQDMFVTVTFVDDHSTDSSPEMLKSICAQNDTLRYLRLARNSGSHVAILAGLAHSHEDCVVFMAADLQDPPELIPQMLELWRGGKHIVWAVRKEREGISALDKFFSRAFYWLLNRFSQQSQPPQGSDFALVDRKIVKALMPSVGPNLSLFLEIARLGFSQASIEYVKAKREFGHTKWNLERKLRAFADAFVATSYVPLRAMSYLGIVFSLFGLLYAGLIVFLRLLSEVPIEGWSSLMVVVLVFGGIQMTMMGILGEYLWRTLEQARHRPLFFLEDWHGIEDPTEPAGRTKPQEEQVVQ